MREVSDLSGYDTIVAGSAIHHQEWLPEAGSSCPGSLPPRVIRPYRCSASGCLRLQTNPGLGPATEPVRPPAQPSRRQRRTGAMRNDAGGDRDRRGEETGAPLAQAGCDVALALQIAFFAPPWTGVLRAVELRGGGAREGRRCPCRCCRWRDKLPMGGESDAAPPVLMGMRKMVWDVPAGRVRRCRSRECCCRC